MTKYTFTFEREAENKFRSVLERLEDDEYTIVEDVNLVNPDEPRYSARQTVMEMDSEACLTFRMAMGDHIKIHRERTEEEIAADEARDAMHKITITVQVPPSSTNNP